MLCRSLEKTDLPLFLSAAGDRYIGSEKMDGERMILDYKNNILKLTNREGVDVTFRYPELHDFKFDKDIVLDGELVCFDKNEVSQFLTGIAFRSHLSVVTKEIMRKYPITYVVFDILELGGE